MAMNDVRVNQIGDQFRLADEIVYEGLLAGVVGADDFDGHAFEKAARAALLGLVHHSHAAFKNLADDFVAELALDGEHCHAADVGKSRLQVKPLVQRRVRERLILRRFFYNFSLRGSLSGL
jgi:hypothetical protein